MRKNFGIQAMNFLCPNITEYYLMEPNWLDFEKQYYSELNFYVEAREGFEEYAEKTYIYTSYNAPFYSPE